jgi:hypothetical protein
MINDSAIMGYKVDDGVGVISLPEKPNNKHQHPSNTTRLTISRWRNRGNANPSLKKFYVRLSSLIGKLKLFIADSMPKDYSFYNRIQPNLPMILFAPFERLSKTASK